MIKQFYNFIKFTIRVALIVSLGLASTVVMFALFSFVGMAVMKVVCAALVTIMVVIGLWFGAQEFYKEKSDDN